MGVLYVSVIILMHGCAPFIHFNLQTDVHTLRVYMYANPYNNIRSIIIRIGLELYPCVLCSTLVLIKMTTHMLVRLSFFSLRNVCAWLLTFFYARRRTCVTILVTNLDFNMWLSFSQYIIFSHVKYRETLYHRINIIGYIYY